jgi:hypothetical protein
VKIGNKMKNRVKQAWRATALDVAQIGLFFLFWAILFVVILQRFLF